MKVVPLLVIIALLVVLFWFMSRARRRQAQGQLQQAERIGVGTDVMTTSGLYGTVVGKHDDGTVALAIAPGLEVRWELAALRDVASLPPNVGGALRGGEIPGDTPGPSPYDPPQDGDPQRP